MKWSAICERSIKGAIKSTTVRALQIIYSNAAHPHLKPFPAPRHSLSALLTCIKPFENKNIYIIISGEMKRMKGSVASQRRIKFWQLCGSNWKKQKDSIYLLHLFFGWLHCKRRLSSLGKSAIQSRQSRSKGFLSLYQSTNPAHHSTPQRNWPAAYWWADI